MTIADMLDGLLRRRTSVLSVRDALIINRAVEALRAGEKLAERADALATIADEAQAEIISGKCRACMAHELPCVRALHDALNAWEWMERPSAAEEKKP